MRSALAAFMRGRRGVIAREGQATVSAGLASFYQLARINLDSVKFDVAEELDFSLAWLWDVLRYRIADASEACQNSSHR